MQVGYPTKTEQLPGTRVAKFLGVNRRFRLPSHANKAPILPTNDLPTDFDWRDHGAVTPVKNQGSCGSCWSFSTTGALEGANFLATGKLVSLSEQQLVDCDHECDPEEKGSCDAGCNGGLMNSALEYTLKAGGLMREEDYPYTGTDHGTCKFEKTKIAAKVANFSVVPIDEEQIAANLVKNGPLAVAINAVYMQTYIGGVSCPLICSKQLDHGVCRLVMVKLAMLPFEGRRSRTHHQNSWGEKWGRKWFSFLLVIKQRNENGKNLYPSSLIELILELHPMKP
ncbi:UNVERIFIED_CONTAM: putative cysteine protease RD19B [Sesamum angustifolium]|uniref:Cysteine protease RD19B n=1 Tax=Sesamum angustifolium TaxID=2727405 RepID=A0AAW2QCL7_9LAMI